MVWEDEAYVHEAFLADWRPDNSNISSKCPTRIPSLEGSQVREEMDNSGGGDFNTQSCTKFSSASRYPLSSMSISFLHVFGITFSSLSFIILCFLLNFKALWLPSSFATLQSSQSK